MGFDIFGNNKDANGEDEYFQNNVWWWHQLWDFCCDVAPEILTAEDREKGQWNDCHPISKAKALRLGRLLLDKIAAGEIDKKTEKKYTSSTIYGGQKFDYPFTVENVKQFAEFCIRSGGFKIC